MLFGAMCVRHALLSARAGWSQDLNKQTNKQTNTIGVKPCSAEVHWEWQIIITILYMDCNVQWE